MATTDLGLRLLPDDAPQQCDVTDCRRDHVAEVELATNHVSGGLPWPRAVLGLDRERVQAVPAGWEVIVYDPAHEAAVTVSRTFAGFFHLDDGVVYQMADDRPATFSDLSPISRAVIVARLRAWADHLDHGEANHG